MKITQLLPALLLSGIATGAMAQGFSIGPKVGANFSTFAVSAYNISTPIGDLAVEDMESDTEMQIGPQAGLMFNFAFNETYSFQPELLYSVKGYKQTGTYKGLKSGDMFAGQERDYSIKLNYIELPVLFKVSVGSPTVKGNFMIGPYVSYLIGGENNLTLGSTEIFKGDVNYEFTEENQNYYFERVDYGATVGAGVSFRTTAGSFLLDARYSIGIPEATTYDPSLGDIAVRNRNSTIGISLGYLYHFPYTPKAPKDYGGVFDDDYSF